MILQRSKFGKTASVLLALFVLLLSALASSPSLHKLIHADAGAPDHECVISLFANGQVSSAPAVQILIGLVLLFGGVALLAARLIFSTADYRFSSSRAPPSSPDSFFGRFSNPIKVCIWRSAVWLCSSLLTVNLNQNRFCNPN